jgi:hypothetical protein
MPGETFHFLGPNSRHFPLAILESCHLSTRRFDKLAIVGAGFGEAPEGSSQQA